MDPLCSPVGSAAAAPCFLLQQKCPDPCPMGSEQQKVRGIPESHRSIKNEATPRKDYTCLIQKEEECMCSLLCLSSLHTRRFVSMPAYSLPNTRSLGTEGGVHPCLDPAHVIKAIFKRLQTGIIINNNNNLFISNAKIKKFLCLCNHI